jgi:hypothetical protein
VPKQLSGNNQVTRAIMLRVVTRGTS